MKIAQAIIDQITKSVARQVVKDLAPVVTVAVENALVRRGKPAARYEADVLAATVRAFVGVMAEKKVKPSDVTGPAVAYRFNMNDLSLLRQMQQALEAYTERLRNGEN